MLTIYKTNQKTYDTEFLQPFLFLYDRSMKCYLSKGKYQVSSRNIKENVFLRFWKQIWFVWKYSPNEQSILMYLWFLPQNLIPRSL